MTLQQFLEAVADTPEDDFRRALTVALLEMRRPPTDPADYRRLYRLVEEELRRDSTDLSAVA